MYFLFAWFEKHKVKAIVRDSNYVTILLLYGLIIDPIDLNPILLVNIEFAFSDIDANYCDYRFIIIGFKFDTFNIYFFFGIQYYSFPPYILKFIIEFFNF